MPDQEIYTETQKYEDNNPFRILDFIQGMDNLRWKYKCNTPGREQFSGAPEELIEEVIELEHDRKQYFKTYDISVGSDGEVLINKEYEGLSSSETVVPLQNELRDIELVIRGEMEQEAIDELIF